jgi:hypothetical protein
MPETSRVVIALREAARLDSAADSTDDRTDAKLVRIAHGGVRA